MRLPSLGRPALVVGLFVTLLFGLGTAATVLIFGDFGSYRWPVGYSLGMVLSLTLGLVVVHLVPDYVEGAADELGDRLGEFFVYGLITLVVFAVLAFVLGTTAIGILGVGVLLPVAVLVASQVPFLGWFPNTLGTGAVVGLWSDRGR